MNEENNGLNHLGPVESKPFDTVDQQVPQVIDMPAQPSVGPIVNEQPSVGQVVNEQPPVVDNSQMGMNVQNNDIFVNNTQNQGNTQMSFGEAPQLINSAGVVLNSSMPNDIPLPKIPSIPPGTIEEINNNYQIEQTQIANVEAATKDMDSSYKILKILYFVLLGSSIVDLLMGIFLTNGNLVLQVIIDALILIISIVGVIFTFKKSKSIVLVSIISFVISLLSFSIPLIVGLIIVIFGLKISNDLKAL